MHPTYYLLNIKNEIPEWTWDSPLERKIAPIFFGNLNCEKFLLSSDKRFASAKNFLTLNGSDNWIISISPNYLWMYQVTGDPKDESPIFLKDGSSDIPKIRDISNIKKINLGEAPFIIASMRVNQAFCRNTFLQINPDKYIGNCVALDYLLFKNSNRKYSELDCLSALELETLIAKIFEESGFFVPAYRGGSLKDVDIYAEKIASSGAPSLSSLFDDVTRIEIQIKKHIDEKFTMKIMKSWRRSSSQDKEKLCRILISSDTTVETSIENGVFGPDWITQSLKKLPITSEWLKKSLRWLYS